MLCPHCEQEHPETSRYCPKTGAPLDWAMPICPSCGREVHPGARFCAACGQEVPREIHRPAAASAQAAAQTPASMGAPASAGAPAEAPIQTPAPQAPPTGSEARTRPSQPSPASTPAAGNAPALAWTATPTGPRRTASPSHAAARRPAPASPWQGYLLGALALIALIAGLVAVLRPPEARDGSPQAALLSASATAAAALPPGSPTPLPPTPAPPTLPPSPAATQPPSPSDTPAVGAVALTPQPTALTPTATPSYQLAFFSNRDNLANLYLMDPDHPADWLAVPLPENYESAAWPSFCGERLAFEARDRSFALPLWIFLYNLEQGNVAPLTIAGELPERLMHPGCSPGGRFIVMSAFRAGDWFLSMLDFNLNSIVAEQPAGEYASLGFAAWPQGEDRFFWMGIRPTGYFDINETRTLDGHKFGITRLVSQGKYPAISPDGKQMASFCGNLLYLCMVERASNKLLFQIPVSYFKQIDKKEVPASAAWSSSGEWVYFSSSTSGNWDIYRMRPDGSMIQNLTEDWPSDEYMPAAR